MRASLLVCRQFSRLKEQLLRATQEALGERYLMDAIVPGGTRADLADSAATPLATCVHQLADEARTLRAIYDDHEGVRDRFTGAGAVAPELAARLGLTGLAGRASGQAFDLRIDLPCEPYTELSPVMVERSEGDVAARVAVRFDELRNPVFSFGAFSRRSRRGPTLHPFTRPPIRSVGVGLIEGWRGTGARRA